MNIHLPAILGFTRGTRVLTHTHMSPKEWWKGLLFENTKGGLRQSLGLGNANRSPDENS